MIPSMDIKTFARALLDGTSPTALLAEFGPDAGDDLPIDPTGTDDLDSLRGSRILPTIGICRYLASDDPLTNTAIDSMELALERDYGITAPFFITSMRSGREGHNLSIDYFYLEKEEG